MLFSLFQIPGIFFPLLMDFTIKLFSLRLKLLPQSIALLQFLFINSYILILEVAGSSF
jgi:hypothetical protein